VSVTVSQGVPVVGVVAAGDTDGLAGWPVTVGVVQVRVFTLHTGAGWAW